MVPPFVLLRHGQSQWNLENRFTGWTDIPLTGSGRDEARQAARLIKSNGLDFDLAWTSELIRAVETLDIVLEVLGRDSIPVRRNWRLNERHYGSLQGLNKAETAARLGEQLVMGWRRSYTARPPALELDDPRHPRFDPLYSNIPIGELPRTESLWDTEKRILPLWEGEIIPEILAGKRVLIVAHANSLRALVRHLEQIPPESVPALTIPTGIPQVVECSSEGSSIRRYDLKSSKPKG